MASQLPPDIIQVKRKRGVEDGPVDFLRVDAHKRHRSTSGDAVWVYQRKQSSMGLPRGPSMPIIRATEEGDENRPVKPLPLRPKKSRPTVADRRVDTSLKVMSPADQNSVAATENVRRFHLSIPDSSRLAATGTPGKRSAPAVFVERTPKKLRDSIGPITRKDEPQFAQPATATTPKELEPVASGTKAQEPAQSTYKRPGQRARTKHTQELPKSLVQRDEGVDMDQLAKDMDAYTLSQITENMAKMEEDNAKIAARKAKYKPKPPTKRFAERHPEYAAAKAAQAAAMAAAIAAESQDTDGMAMDTTPDQADDDDYVMETYERVPASRLRDQAVPASRVGLLVFDTEPDKADFFYGEEGDSDDEFPEDEENENAENYYTADYPDEDMDWDDIVGRNPTRFLTQNASDNEEYDLTINDEDGFLDNVWEQSQSESEVKDVC